MLHHPRSGLWKTKLTHYLFLPKLGRSGTIW